MALNRTRKTEVTKNINNDEVVFNGVLSMISSSEETPWTGTMTELRDSLTGLLSKRDGKLLPRSPSALRVVLNRVVNRLRNRRISVKFGRTNDHTRTRFVRFTA